MPSRMTSLLLVLPLLLGLCACADVVAHTSPSAAVSPSPAAAPHIVQVPEGLGKGGVQMHPPSPIPARPTPVVTDVAGAAAIIARVTDVNPRLLPASIPAGMEEVTVTAGPGTYEVRYTDDTHTRQIIFFTDEGFGINGPHQVMRTMQFRGQSANYVIFDPTVPTTRHELDWREPGSQLHSGGTEPFVQYSIIAYGLTEAEFFQLANSLQPV
jgi:hypothetical protein